MGRGGAVFPIYTAQAPGCSIWSGPCVERSPSFRVLHKSADSVAPAFCAFPGRAAQAARSLSGALPGCGAPPPLRGPSLSFSSSRSGACALCLAATLLADVDYPEFQKSLVRNSRPVCSVIGYAAFGAEFAPFPSPRLLSPAGLGRSKAG